MKKWVKEKLETIYKLEYHEKVIRKNARKGEERARETMHHFLHAARGGESHSHSIKQRCIILVYQPAKLIG